MKTIVAAVAALLLSTPWQANAQETGAEASLGACMVAAATPEDRVVLARWVFSAMADHPGLRDLAHREPSVNAGLDQDMARLFERLTTRDCTVQARDALADDMEGVFAEGFRVLGEVAMESLVEDPQVRARIGQFAEKVDHAAVMRALLKAGQ